MTAHPDTKIIAEALERLATRLRNDGNFAIDLADALASRGLPSNTLGSGSRSATTTTSTERAAGADQDNERDTRWDDVDLRLARLLHITWRATTAADTLLSDVLTHGSDLDPVPAGTGACTCCGNFMRPDHKHPDRRLRSGYCPNCHRAWLRWRKTNHPDRARFEHQRRTELLNRANTRAQQNALGA